MGFHVGLDALEERKIFCPLREFNHESSVIRPVVLSLWRLATPGHYGSTVRLCVLGCYDYYCLQHHHHLVVKIVVR